MGSKVGGVVSAVLVLALSFVPAAPVTNVAVAQPYVIGMNVTPQNEAVGPGANFSVYLWVVDNAAQAYDTMAIRLTYNTSIINATSVTPNPYFAINLLNDYNNSWDPANKTGLIRSDNGWLISNSTSSMWACQVNFTAGNNWGTSPLNFTPEETFDTTDVLRYGESLLNWSLVSNGSVTIASCCACCVIIAGNGTVSIDGTNVTPPGGCKCDGIPNHTFTLQAYPDAGWQFVNWTGNVSNTTANPTTITVIYGGTDTITANFAELPPQVCVNTTLLDFGTLVLGSCSNPANKTFTVTNCGGGSLNWTSSISYDPTNPNNTCPCTCTICPWCSCNPGYNLWCSYSPTSGGPLGNGSSQTIQVAVDTANLTAVGSYNATINITGSSSQQVRVTFYIMGSCCLMTCRNIVLPHGDYVCSTENYVCPGESFDVWVDIPGLYFTTISNVTLVDNTTVTNSNGDSFFWDNVTQIEEEPAASSKTVSGTGNTTVEYLWAGDWTPSTEFIAHYNVTVPPGTPPGLYSMTVCPANSTAWVEFYIDGVEYTSCIDCEYQIKVIGATLNGSMSFSGAAAGRVMNVSFFDNSTHLLRFSLNTAINATGNFTISDITPGLYDIGVKNWTCLSEVERGVNLTAGNTTCVDFGSSCEGDSNNNDRINAVDFSLLAGAYGSTPGSAKWNWHCDFDRDGAITAADFSQLSGNYGKQGDLFSYL